jgi:hypothetical protein
MNASKRSMHGSKRSMNGSKRSMHGSKRSMNASKRSMNGSKRSMHGSKRSMNASKRSMNGSKSTFDTLATDEKNGSSGRSAARRRGITTRCDGAHRPHSSRTTVSTSRSRSAVTSIRSPRSNPSCCSHTPDMRMNGTTVCRRRYPALSRYIAATTNSRFPPPPPRLLGRRYSGDAKGRPAACEFFLVTFASSEPNANHYHGHWTI